MDEKRPDLNDALRELAAEEAADVGPHVGWDLLIAYRWGTLAAAESEALQEHLSLCPKCADRLLELRDLETASTGGGAEGLVSIRQEAWEYLSSNTAQRGVHKDASEALGLSTQYPLRLWKQLAEAERELAATRARPESKSSQVQELETWVAELTRQERELRDHLEAAAASDDAPEILGDSAHTQALRRMLHETYIPALDVENPEPILILGERGTGKDLIARYLHAFSARHKRPLVVVNCAEITDELAASRFFGHKKGLFTGALTDEPGFFRAADGGVLFLDEIDELSPRAQAHLLRVLESHMVTPVGQTRGIPVDVAVVLATNRDLTEAVQAGTLREDFYDRFRTLAIRLLPLRERPWDIPMLLEHYRRHHERKHRKRTLGFTPEALRALAAYSWPGNVRDLARACALFVIHAQPGAPIDLALIQRCLPEVLQETPNPEAAPVPQSQNREELTPEGFEALLRFLDPDHEQPAVIYETIRRRLVRLARESGDDDKFLAEIRRRLTVHRASSLGKVTSRQLSELAKLVLVAGPEWRDQTASPEIQVSVSSRLALRGQEAAESGFLRRGSAVNTVRISAQADGFTAAINLADYPVYHEYRLELIDRDGKVLWTGHRPGDALLGDAGTAVSIRGLGPGRYRLRIEGWRPGRTKLLARYLLAIEWQETPPE